MQTTEQLFLKERDSNILHKFFALQAQIVDIAEFVIS